MPLVPMLRRRKPEVYIAPLIDVIFLLLIFYAVTTQFVSDERLKLKLPEAKTAEAAGAGLEKRPPVIKVARDGSVWIDDRIVPERELEARIRGLVRRGHDVHFRRRGARCLARARHVVDRRRQGQEDHGPHARNIHGSGGMYLLGELDRSS